MLWAAVTLILSLRAGAEPLRYSPPAFADQNRRQKIEPLLPDLDKIFLDFAAANHVPGLVYGVVLDGKLIHSGAVGMANLERKIPAASDTRFRIASMTKSFVALAILKLRDEGKLRLDDRVDRILPELRRVRPPTADSPAITIRNLMTMTTGLPEDNPWGDQQLAIRVEELRKFVSGGLAFSNPPGQQFEYSNLGFVLLGQVVSKVSGLPYQKYITKNILRPLGMMNTVWEFGEVPADKLALGYRREDDAWKLEPMLHDGEGAAAGGLLTTMGDFARYVAFHLDAWPARDDPDRGPVRRATLREMHQPSVLSGLNAKTMMPDGKTPNPSVGFYCYGLGRTVDSRGIVRVSHSGGLPGFGSRYTFCPDYNVAVIAFANLTYEAMGKPLSEGLNLLLEPGRLEPRAQVASAILETRKKQIADLVLSWDERLGREILAENFFLDRSRDHWIKLAREKLEPLGKITSVGAVVAENQLRGEFSIAGEKGHVDLYFTLTPESVPKVQELQLKFVPNP